METVSIETTQNVRVDYEVASVGDRIVATLIDYAVFVGYGFLYLLLAGVTEGFGNSTVIGILLILPVFFYDLLCEIFMDGRSVGKLVMKIKVVKIDGTQPSLGSYLLRWVFRLVDMKLFSPAVALITVVLSEKGQRLGDMVAKTSVIKMRQKTRLHDTLLSRVQNDYVPVFPQVSSLTDRDVSTIKDVMRVAQRTQNWEAMHQLANKTKEIIQVASSMPDYQFLQTVIHDYTNYDFGE